MIDEQLTALRYKSEGTDIDFKSSQYRFIGGSEENKAEILKDILAIANAWREGTGYILLGFKERRPHPAEVIGISESIDDAQLQQLVNSKVKPKLTFRYEEHIYEGKTVGVISIPKQKRAFYLAHPYGKLKSNVVYVRRGSSTDEAEPPEITDMAMADAGRGDVRLELSILTPTNDNLPDLFQLNYLQFTEKFPDYASARQTAGPFQMSVTSPVWHDNANYWRKYAEYIQVNDGLIEMKFVLLNRSEMQLSNAKLEVFVEAIDSQSYKLLAGADLPEKPESNWSLIHSMPTLPDIMSRQNAPLVVDDGGAAPICSVRFGSLLPSEEGRSSDTLAIIVSSPGRLRLRFRILASELAVPNESERMIECAGAIERLDFSGFKDFVRERLARTQSDQ